MSRIVRWLRSRLNPVRYAEHRYDASRDGKVRSLEATRLRSVRRERDIATMGARIRRERGAG